ncbi:solute carrier family 22 member 5-like isoform X2 [Plectropomus leopardus]|uniref:solute carrier family 22 member 5-like isoform X2 n=1 Tax=Plectropomus leopardus TaxID=160734 RepID=UPI001C4BFCF9|nr:solute carrier family 22 member 5-like isoform X2 [Plectropomus leopardus]
MKDYDDTISFLGQWGCFQQIVFFLLCASIMPNGFGALSVVFLTAIPSHHCLVPEVNLSEDWRNAIIPIEVVNGEPELSRCSRYRLDVVQNLSAQGFIPDRDVNLTDLEQEGCVDGWSYNSDTYQSTIVTEFDLVCDDQWKQPFTTTVFYLGFLAGSFFSGQLSDRFGRKPVLFATMALQTLFTFSEMFSPSWTVFAILLFFNGLGHNSNYVSGFVLGTEIFTGKVRVLFSSMGVCLGFAVGYMLLPLFAYFLRDWKSLLLGVSLPGLLYIPFWWFIPESPRWLLSQGRVQEAEAIVREAAKKNKVGAPQADEKETTPKEHHNVLDLLRTDNIRNMSFILCLVWITMSAGYYGLSLNTSRLHANPYISCFFSAAVEVPAYISSWLALRYLPRRLSVILVLLVAGVSLYFIPLVPKSISELAVALEMLGKYSITVGIALIFAYTAELYPTVLRNTATGTCTTISRVGSCVVPFLLLLGDYFRYLPYITLGTLSVVSAFAALFLPESFGRPLPQTIQEMQKRESMRCPFNTRKEHSKPVVLFESQL